METDARPYPDWWLERARERRALLDGAVARLRRAVCADAEIVGALIFGSYVSGRVGPESDLDLIVVTTLAANGDAGGRHAALAKRLALGVPCDLIVVDESEFEQRSRERPFYADARHHGTWIDATTSA